VLESRAFHAHVTLIRRAREPGAELPPPPRVDWPVDEFVLVRSALSREGSRYEVLERFALRGGARPGRK
jgi:2'-5' RNA ligase